MYALIASALFLVAFGVLAWQVMPQVRILRGAEANKFPPSHIGGPISAYASIALG